MNIESGMEHGQRTKQETGRERQKGALSDAKLPGRFSVYQAQRELDDAVNQRRRDLDDT